MCNNNLILTLHKHHYLDKYNITEEGKYNFSCLGYYDEISIKKNDECLNENIKEDNMPFSGIWYGTGEQINSQEGGYSNQNIGLFRDTKDEVANEKAESYWQIEKGLPFFALGFLKKNEIDNLNNLKKTIENLEYTKEENKGEKKCQLITYDTFDNADTVLFIKSNSFNQFITCLKILKICQK